ncbi:MAG: hypothetical protein AAGA85_08140 [Bacteroidota bacterium]
MSKILYTVLCSLALAGCAVEEQPPATLADPDWRLDNGLNHLDLTAGLDEDFLLATTELPDELGALSRNKEGYFSVRFQLGILELAGAAVRYQDLAMLERVERSLFYAFSHQQPDGGFLITPPQALTDSGIAPPSAADSVSAAAFYGYALAMSLEAWYTSDWFLTSQEASGTRSFITSLRPEIETLLRYIDQRQDLVFMADSTAPNRLLFDAIALFGLGKWLDDQEAQDLGIHFMQRALDQVSADEGYFIEGGGWDSSYNGVALMLGLELFTLMDESNLEKEALGLTLIRSALWQTSRILETGEISTAGNTRVFPGGESFLGNEKTVDAKKTIRAFYYLRTLTGRSEFDDLANRVFDFYR